MEEKEDLMKKFEEERRKSNTTALISVGVAILLVITFFLGFFVRGTTEPAFGQKIYEIVKIIESSSVYSDDKSVDERTKMLVQAILKEDKYAHYYTEEEYNLILSENAGLYSGIGIALTLDYSVADVYMNSPAYKAGVMPGDKFLAGIFKGDEEYTAFSDRLAELNAVEGTQADMFNVLSEFFSAFEPREPFKIKISRGENEQAVELEIEVYKDSNYVVSYVEYKDDEKYFEFSTEEDGFKGRESAQSAEKCLPELSDDTAYIRLTAFEGGAADQFAEALKYMRNRGKSKLILDLRNNGGGQVEILADIAEYIVNNINADNKNRIPLMEVREKLSVNHVYTSSNRFTEGLTDISIIANLNTASASECLIGALSDYGNSQSYGGAEFNLDRLILTQQDGSGNYRTFGKGIMQTTIALSTGGALKLTTAYISWPITKTSVQDTGITTAVQENCVADEDAVARANAVLH